MEVGRWSAVVDTKGIISSGEMSSILSLELSTATLADSSGNSSTNRESTAAADSSAADSKTGVVADANSSCSGTANRYEF
ncbi:hypothetical protein Taro_047672 [Colocasia esculenta]|uniref:Uncharacterized protein n=1 Tax=Colocasia esculenta TaxID=4460 RepID=A0A843WWP2_COLES|nr:hypothetical protein [Colocasia esculenta]